MSKFLNLMTFVGIVISRYQPEPRRLIAVISSITFETRRISENHLCHRSDFVEERCSRCSIRTCAGEGATVDRTTWCCTANGAQPQHMAHMAHSTTYQLERSEIGSLFDQVHGSSWFMVHGCQDLCLLAAHGLRHRVKKADCETPELLGCSDKRRKMWESVENGFQTINISSIYHQYHQ